MFSIEDRRKIHEESGCADVTIRAFPNVSGASRRRIERACAALGITMPPAGGAAAITSIPATAA